MLLNFINISPVTENTYVEGVIDFETTVNNSEYIKMLQKDVDLKIPRQFLTIPIQSKISSDMFETIVIFETL